MFKALGRVLTSLVLLAVASTTVDAKTWNIDTSHSVLDFKVRHLFSKTGGSFDKWGGTIDFDPTDLSKGSVEINVETASINTENEDRDGHLRSPDFFNVEAHPMMTFKSTKVSNDDGNWSVEGDLTLLGVTKSVVIPFEFHGAGPGPWGGEVAGFSGEFKLNRKDFGMVWNKGLDQGGLVLGDEVTIEIEIEAGHKPEAGR